MLYKQVSSLNHEKSCLMDQLSLEQDKAEENALKMESKLRELQVTWITF